MQSLPDDIKNNNTRRSSPKNKVLFSGFDRKLLNPGVRFKKRKYFARSSNTIDMKKQLGGG
jgi:hypothetical protein